MKSLFNTLKNLNWREIYHRFGIPKFHRFEVIAMRILFAYVLYQTMPLGAPFSNVGIHVSSEIDGAFRPPLPPISSLLPNTNGQMEFDEMRQPNGIGKFIDLTFFSRDDVTAALPWIVIPCLLIYISGYGLPVALPILCFISLGSRTLYNSQGYIHHGFQMVSLILLAQTIVVLWWTFRKPKEAMGFSKPTAATKNGRTFWDVMIRYTQLMIIASYMIPGVIKQFKSGGEWFLNSHFIGVQVVKTHRQNYYNDLSDSELSPEEIPEMADFMLGKPNISRILLGCGVGLQLIAFFGLYNRLTLLIFGLMFVVFHYLNDAMFGLYFYHVEKMDWIFLVNLPFWIWWLWHRFSNRAVPNATNAE